MKNTRPTTDRAREALFNILANKLDYSSIRSLDLFSGTGSIAYELCSRGSQRVVAVDNDPGMVSFIQQTAASMGFSALHAIRMDATQYILTCEESFDLIIADPPYAWPAVSKLPEIVFSRRILLPGGYFVLEHSANVDVSEKDLLVLQRNYGDTRFSIFQAAYN